MKTVELCASLRDLRSRVKRGTDITIPGGLTTKQAGVLLFCRQQVMLYGRMPTVRQVQAAFELRSLSTAQFHLKNLREKNLLPREKSELVLTLNEGAMLLDLIDKKDGLLRAYAARGNPA